MGWGQTCRIWGRGVGELTIIGPTTTVEDGSRVDDHVNSHMGEKQGDGRNDIRGGFLEFESL